MSIPLPLPDEAVVERRDLEAAIKHNVSLLGDEAPLGNKQLRRVIEFRPPEPAYPAPAAIPFLNTRGSAVASARRGTSSPSCSRCGTGTSQCTLGGCSMPPVPAA